MDDPNIMVTTFIPNNTQQKISEIEVIEDIFVTSIPVTIYEVPPGKNALVTGLMGAIKNPAGTPVVSIFINSVLWKTFSNFLTIPTESIINMSYLQYGTLDFKLNSGMKIEGSSVSNNPSITTILKILELPI